MGDDMAASVGGGGVDGRSRGWPKCGLSPGRPMAVLPRWMVVVVVVVVKGKERMGWSQYVTLVTFQPWWLDLATCVILERKYQV